MNIVEAGVRIDVGNGQRHHKRRRQLEGMEELVESPSCR